MGHRTYLIKETAPNNFEYVYSHWGASQFLRLSGEHFYSEEEIGLEEVENRFSDLWDQAVENGEKVETAESLDGIIDISQITIEAYVIQDKEGDLHLVLPTITSEVHFAVADRIQGPRTINRLRGEKDTVESYVRVAENQGLDEETIREGVKKFFSRKRHNSTRLIGRKPMDGYTVSTGVNV